MIVLTGGVGLLFQFLESSIFFKFFDVVSQIGFFLFDLFFFDPASDRGRLLGLDYELVI